MTGKMVSDSESLRLLGTWNQAAMRAYVRQVFCLQLDDKLEDFGELRTRIQHALSLACKRFPHFAGKIRRGGDSTLGRVYVSTTGSDVVPFRFFDNRRSGPSSPSATPPLLFGWSYPELRAQGFPCKAFVGPWFDLPYDSGMTEDGPGVPVTEIHARVIRGGGLLLCIYTHHSISDGIGMCNFVSTFAAYTFQDASDVGRVLVVYPADIDVDIAEEKTADLINKLSFEELMAKCPEYTILSQPTGPTAPCKRQDWGPSLGDVPKTGRIFTFTHDRIGELKSLARDWASRNAANDCSKNIGPSTFACLAAVSWSFCTVARLDSSQLAAIADDDCWADKAQLLVPASWRRRAFRQSLDGYASNAVCMPRISAPVNSLSVIGDGTAASPATNATNKEEELGKLICLIDSSITSIDDEFVTTRTAMFRAAPDPRFVGVNLDPQDPLDFIVNSWRHLGGDVVFGLPGLKPAGDEPGERGRRADAVRRAQPAWNMGACLVLPGKKRDSDYEILVTLDQESMGRLLTNREWMKWVSRMTE